ncbi:MAG: glycoside hydrolase family 16 protein [Phycisphaerae bacterium]
MTPVQIPLSSQSVQHGSMVTVARRLVLLAAALTASAASVRASTIAAPAVTAPSGLQWTSTFSDNFSSASSLNGWTYDTGNNNGWGNGESENYTNSSNNVNVSGGNLNIQAIGTATASGTYYTSGRITTQSLFSQTYGLFQFSAQLPAGAGLWPAIWMMPTNSAYGGWPQSGEIDVMESQGSNTSQVQGSLHSGPNSNSNNTQTQVYTLPNNGSTTSWHTYDLQWEPISNGSGGTQVQLNWYVDGNLYETQSGGWTVPSTAPAGDNNAPFDQSFYIIMNLAVGGSYTGYQTPGVGTYDMKVGYVSAYQAALPTVTAASAIDSATNYQANSNFNHTNAGTGFGQWNVAFNYSGPSGAAGGGGGLIMTSNTGIAAATPAFDIYVYPGTVADTGLNTDITTATRAFAATLVPGQTFTTDLNLNKGQTTAGNPTPQSPATADSNMGWRLLDSSGKVLFAMTAFGGGSSYWSTDAKGIAQQANILYNYQIDDMFKFTLLNALGDYSLTASGNTSTGQAVTFSGQINMLTGGPAQVQYFDNNGGNNSDVQWSQMSISGDPVPEPSDLGLTALAAGALLILPQCRKRVRKL